MLQSEDIAPGAAKVALTGQRCTEWPPLQVDPMTGVPTMEDRDTLGRRIDQPGPFHNYYITWPGTRLPMDDLREARYGGRVALRMVFETSMLDRNKANACLGADYFFQSSSSLPTQRGFRYMWRRYVDGGRSRLALDHGSLAACSSRIARVDQVGRGRKDWEPVGAGRPLTADKPSFHVSPQAFPSSRGGEGSA